jgi:homocysteine S-methyltransferase
MSAYEAAHYHAASVETFAQTEADMVTARAMTYVEEASGIALLASACSIPAVISFKPGPSGRLLSGDTLSQAIERIDRETQRHPAYYMIECTHGSQLAEILGRGAAWLARIRGVRLTRSHSSLDLADAQALARHYRMLSSMLPNLSVVGTEYDRLDTVHPVRNHEVTAAGMPYSAEFVIGAGGHRSGPALTRSASSAAKRLSARVFS